MKPLSARFEEKFMPEPNSGCWLWTGAIDTAGYGRIRLPGIRVLEGAHRIAWFMCRGPIPDHLYVLHKCDVKSCVNPDHLFLGDQAANVADLYSKRTPRHVRISRAQVAEMRALHQTGVSRADLARRFDMSWSQTDKIVRGETRVAF